MKFDRLFKQYSEGYRRPSYLPHYTKTWHDYRDQQNDRNHGLEREEEPLIPAGYYKSNPETDLKTQVLRNKRTGKYMMAREDKTKIATFKSISHAKNVLSKFKFGANDMEIVAADSLSEPDKEKIYQAPRQPDKFKTIWGVPNVPGGDID